jgi:hypothetical protein
MYLKINQTATYELIPIGERLKPGEYKKYVGAS